MVHYCICMCAVFCVYMYSTNVCTYTSCMCVLVTTCVDSTAAIYGRASLRNCIVYTSHVITCNCDMSVHVCTCMYMYVHVCTCMYMYVHVHVCTCTCMYMYMYVHVYM